MAAAGSQVRPLQTRAPRLKHAQQQAQKAQNMSGKATMMQIRGVLELRVQGETAGIEKQNQ